MSHLQIQEPGTAERSPGMMDRARSLSVGSVIVGAVIGVIVGLIMGWVLWPVQWTDAWPGDLTEEARAQYLAAVAQVYAYYPDDRAAETARARLYDLQGDIGDEIANAQTYFADNPQRDSNVYITVLTELAAGLGASQEAPAISTTPEVEGAASSSGGPSWLKWIFSLLLVIVLVGGGIYIISRLARRRGEGAGGYQPAEAYPSQGGYAGQPAPSSRGSFNMPAPEDYRFDQEPDEGIVYTSGTAVVDGEEYDDDTYFDEGSSASFSQPNDSDAYRPPRPPASSTYGAQAMNDYQASETVATTYPSRASSSAAIQEPAVQEPARVEAGKVLDTYMVHYQAGMQEFEQSHNIVDPTTSRYIGECGMGVNMKNGVLQDVPENVIALDVWLFDQRQDRSLGHQTRVLLSEYAIDHDLEQAFIRERPDGPTPVVAQPGVSFQLTGENLVMDCEVLDVHYTDSGQESGIFQDVKIEMTVRTRK